MLEFDKIKNMLIGQENLTDILDYENRNIQSQMNDCINKKRQLEQ